jgi:hypothetical protein
VSAFSGIALIDPPGVYPAVQKWKCAQILTTEFNRSKQVSDRDGLDGPEDSQKDRAAYHDENDGAEEFEDRLDWV